MHIEKANTTIELEPESGETESQEFYNIKEISGENLELIKTALQAAHMMEEPVKSSIDIEDVEELHDKIEEALKNPEERLKETMNDDRSLEEQLDDIQGDRDEE